MGRKGKWLISVKRVFSPESKEKKGGQKSRRRWGFGKCSNPSPADSLEEDDPFVPPLPLPLPPKPPHAEEIKLVDAESDQSKHAYSVVAAVAPQAAAEVALPTTSARLAGSPREEIAAIKIQTAFRGYLARRALQALRGLVRLKSLVHGNGIKRQTASTLRSMQTLARVQSQIRSRRIRMTEENQALQRQLQLKRERELEKLRMGEKWDDSLQSKEQIETNLLNRQEAAIRRERALAYAYSHQWKSSSRSVNSTFMDPDNPQWGWSWLERWMAARPWESRNAAGNDHASVRSASHSIGGSEISKSYAHRDMISGRPSPAAAKSSRALTRQSPPTPPSKASSVTGRAKPSNPRGGWAPPEDELRSILSLQSEQHMRHSIAGSSMRDDESLMSSPAVPSYMAPTQSAKARSRLQSPSSDKIETPMSGSVGSAKKRLSFPAADKHSSVPAVRRHSGPPKVDSASLKEVSVGSEQDNGGSL